MENEIRKNKARLHSLDALRGFDMFWITGGTAIILAAGHLLPGNRTEKLMEQFDHVQWEGLHFFDLIWPLFMFIMGVAIPFSVARRRSEGAGDRSILLHALKRSVIMFLLGTMTQGNLLQFDLSVFRPCYSVLHGLAVGYLIATIVAVKVKADLHSHIIGILLLLYWAAVSFIPVPGNEPGVLLPGVNIATWIDRQVLGRFHFGENTWFLTYPAFGTSALFGVLAGNILMENISHHEKISRLVIYGAMYLFAGLLWSTFFPVIKLMWTSSFALIGGAYGFFMMALFYWIIDVLGYRKWAFIFTVIGMNSIAVYLAVSLFDFSVISNIFIGNLAPKLGAWGGLLSAVAAFTVLWLILYWMFRRKEFIRI